MPIQIEFDRFEIGELAEAAYSCHLNAVEINLKEIKPWSNSLIKENQTVVILRKLHEEDESLYPKYLGLCNGKLYIFLEFELKKFQK